MCSVGHVRLLVTYAAPFIRLHMQCPRTRPFLSTRQPLMSFNFHQRKLGRVVEDNLCQRKIFRRRGTMWWTRDYSDMPIEGARVMSESLHEMKAEQSRKISELRETLSVAGFHTIGEQSHALGVSRSTAWTIHKAIHKGSGLSATIINRMLAAPHLPPVARATILEYVDQKAGGRYGQSPAQCRKFVARISTVGHSREPQHKNGQTNSPPLQPVMMIEKTA